MRIRTRDLTAVTRELATLLAAEIPLDASLRILERHAPNGPLKAVLQRVHNDVQSGKALSTALAAHEHVFGALYVNLVRAGEASGSLALVTTRIAEHREQSDEFKSNLISALTYPIALVCVSVVSLLVLMTFVIPRFIPLFADADAPLPLLTEAVFGAARLLQGYWWALVGLAIAAKFAGDRWLAVPGNRTWLDGWMLRAPVIGEVLLFAETVRFARTLGTLLGNGLALLSALKLVKDIQRNSVFEGAIERTIATVRSGGRLAEALARENVLPSLAVEVVMIGEESGQLEHVLEKAAQTFEARAARKLKRILTLLEPVLILGLGALIALVIVAILMAMLSLNELVV
jgi:general secretion pathway protein F